LGTPLFDRLLKASELTGFFGKRMHPLLVRLHQDRVRILDRAQVARPEFERAHRPERPGHRAKRLPPNHVRNFAFGLATVFVCMGMKPSAVMADTHLETTIREVMPSPIRCGRTVEPSFYCRHENPTEHSGVLDLSSTRDGPSASLTHTYDDARSGQLLGIMRNFFVVVGIRADLYDECVSNSTWQPTHVLGQNYKILCSRVELGDRVSLEVIVMPPEEQPLFARVEGATE
jgi:hypothetical protein